jgi:O-antigen ligase
LITSYIKNYVFQILFLLLSLIIISYCAVNWTSYTFVLAGCLLVLMILIPNPIASRMPYYFLFTYVIWGELLYSLCFLYLTKRYGIPAGLTFDIPLITVLFIFMLQITSDSEKFIFDLFDTLISLFIFLILLHLLNGIGKHPDIFNQARGFYFYLLYFPCVYYFKDIKELGKINKFLIWLSVIYSIFAVMDALGIFLPYQYKISQGYFGVVQKLGLTLRFHTIEAAFAIAFFYLLIAILRSSHHTKFSKIRILFLICSMIIIIIYSMTRSYQIAFLISVFIYIFTDLILLKKIKITRYINFVLFLIFIISGLTYLVFKFTPKHLEFVTSIFAKRWDTDFIIKEKSLGRRFDEISFFSNLFLEKPTFGHGIAKEQLFFARERLKYKTKRYITITGPHNELFYYLYSMGIVGTALYLSILFLFLKRSIQNLKILKNKKNLFYYYFQSSILTTIIAFMIISNADWRFRRAHDVVWITFFYAVTRNIYKKSESIE